MLKSQLYEVGPTDLAVFSGVVLALPGVALFATLIPTLRALGVDPLCATSE